METKDALITFPKPGSSSESKRVSFSRARTDIITPKKGKRQTELISNTVIGTVSIS